MEITDATTFSQQVVRMGLVTQMDLDEAFDEARSESGQTVPDLIFLTRTLERRSLLTNFQTSKVLRGDEEGYFLGGYRVLYKISSGSFGRVFRAAEPTSGNVVALKVLRKRWSDDQGRIDLFIREGKVGLSLKHANIVEILAINQDPVTRQYYIAMEFVEGGNLREILTIRKTLSVAESLRILEDCAAGLAYAYSKGITHRDIKLTNTLISTSGEAKLVDFGLAQMFATLASLGGGEEVHVDRTVDYAGLEKATDAKNNDVRSDIFFLGCMFYEMVAGKPPLDMTKDRHARMARRRFEEVRTLKATEVQAPPSVFTLCETMLSFDPRRRFQTPSQLLETIRAARRDLGQPNGTAQAKPAAQSIFLAQSDDRLQGAMRDGFKSQGYRVFLASDPMRALDRFRQQPFDALVVDVGSVGEDGLMVFERVLNEAKDRSVRCAVVAILNQDQADWSDQVSAAANAKVLVRPVTMKQLVLTVKELLKRR